MHHQGQEPKQWFAKQYLSPTAATKNNLTRPSFASPI
jgi:hypothetical protein